MHRYSFQRAPVANPKAIVGAKDKFRFTVLTDGLLRYEWADDGQFEDRASVLAINRRLPVPEYRIKDDEHSLQIITSRFHLTYDKQEFSPSGLHAVIKGHYGAHASIWRYGHQTSDLGGTARTLDEADGRVALEQGVVSRHGFAALDDSKSMLFDEHGWVATRLPGMRMDGYLFAYGHDFRQAIKAFYLLSGPQPVLPRWALGNWWSRYYAYSADEYLSLMDQFQKSGIPLSVAVLDMDWHIVQDDRVKQAGVTGWTGYTWNRALFSDPVAFLAKLHERGLHVALNDHPADGVQGFEDHYGNMADALKYDTTMRDPIPFDITNKAFVDASFDVLHRKFEDQGVDLWWVDWQQGTHSRIPGIDPLWVLNHFHFLDSARDGKRPLTFSRYAGPGSHRYPIGFSGDSIMSWNSLHFQPEFTATASNIGFGWWSHDIGGHFHGVKDDELLIRWIQFGTFSPIMRLHSSNSPFAIKEPWNLDVQYERTMAEFLQFRHRLIPYLYTMNVRAAVEGLPLIQPMYWEYPSKDEAYNVPNQYFFGSQLIVAPITAPVDPRTRRSQVSAWLPPGRHVDIFTGRAYDGDRRLFVARTLNGIPVFAREGAIIPLDAAPVHHNGCNNPTAVELLVVVGADGAFEILEDNGHGCVADQIEFSRIPISFFQEAGELHIGPVENRNNSVHVREWSVRFLGYSSSKTIEICTNCSSKVILGEKVVNGLLVKLGTFPEHDRIVVKLEPNPTLNIDLPSSQVVKFLCNAQIEMDLKESIRAIVESGRPDAVQVGELHTLNLDTAILNCVLEPLLADSRGTKCLQASDGRFNIGPVPPTNGIPQHNQAGGVLNGN